MKQQLIALLLCSSAFAYAEVVTSPVEHLYIPAGFDSNDSVEVVVAGHFPSTCYSRNNVTVKVQNSLIDIQVTALRPEANKDFRACPQMTVPFKEVVTLGNLQGGNYQVRVNNGGKTSLKETLTVTESSSSAVDDHIYAAVEWVESKGDKKYALHGWKYSDCLVIDEVKTVSNNKDTVSVLPIMKQISTFCPMKGMRVVYNVELDLSSIKMKTPLIHVRTMDGKSVNTILNLGK